MVNSASTSFLTRTDARTHVRKPGKLTYRGGTGPPKNSRLGPQKVKKDPKIESKSKVRIELTIENESCSTI